MIVNKEVKCALVTGASSGIGKSICKSLYAKGYDLVIISSNKEKLKEAYNEILSLRKNGKIDMFPIDLSEENAAEKVYAFTEKENIKIDLLVNNAGVGMHGLHINNDVNLINKMLKLNIITLTDLSGLYARNMKANKSGYILNIASAAAYQPVPFMAAYAASKSYVLNFSESLAKELEDYNITVTCFSPGLTNTNFFNHAKVPNSNNFYRINKRFDPQDVADDALSALFQRKLSVLHGFNNKFLVFFSKISSRSIVAKISKLIVST
jgi:short-subunit dehydrogenase